MAGQDVIGQTIKTQLETVTGIGQVHDRIRHAISQKDRDDLWISGGKINAWWVDREAAQDEPWSSNVAFILHHQFVIVGVYGFDDVVSPGTTGSDIVFQDLVDAVLSKFRGQPTLFDTADVQLKRPLNARRIELVMFQSHLCHMAELAMQIDERIQI